MSVRPPPECPKRLSDVVLLIDGSGSIQPYEFQAMKTFIIEVMRRFQGTGTQVPPPPRGGPRTWLLPRGGREGGAFWGGGIGGVSVGGAGGSSFGALVLLGDGGGGLFGGGGGVAFPPMYRVCPPRPPQFALTQFSDTIVHHFDFNAFRGARDPTALVTSVRQLSGTTHTASAILEVL